MKNNPIVIVIITMNSNNPVKNALKKSLKRRLAFTSLNLGNPYKINNAIINIIAISVPLPIKYKITLFPVEMFTTIPFDSAFL